MLLVLVVAAGCGGSKAGTSVEGEGSSNGNRANFGIVGMTEEHIFYNGATGTGRGLFRAKADGTEAELLVEDDAAYINVVGDQVYYVSFGQGTSGQDRFGIFRVEADGSGRTRIGTAVSLDFVVDGEWIYFLDIAHGNHFHVSRMRIDGTQEEELTPDGMNTFSFADDALYFTLPLREGMLVYTVSTAGGELREVSKVPTGWFHITDNRIFDLVEEGGEEVLYQRPLEGTDRKELSRGSFGTINSGDGWVYFVDATAHELVRMKMDGTGRTVLLEEAVEYLHIFGEWLYFLKIHSAEENGGKLHRMKVDGSDLALVEIGVAE